MESSPAPTYGVHQPVDLEHVPLQVAQRRVADAHGRVVRARGLHQTAQLSGAGAEPGLDRKVVVQHLHFILEKIRSAFLRDLLRGDFLALELVGRPAAEHDAQRPQDLAAAEGGLRLAADEQDLVHVVVQDRPEAVEIVPREPPGDGVGYAVAEAVRVPVPLSLDDLERFLAVWHACVPDDQQ